MKLRILVVVAALVTSAVAFWLVRSDLERPKPLVPPAEQFAAGESAEVGLSYADDEPQLAGDFTVTSIEQYESLEPVDEFDDAIGRDGGRVFVAVVECDCPISEDVAAPTFFAADDNDRRWEAVSADPESYAELADLVDPSEIGEENPIAVPAVFVVPEDVEEISVVLVDPTGKPYALRAPVG